MPAELTSASFAETLGSPGEHIVALATALFAYSTLIGWNYYGEKAIEYLFGARAIRIYRILFIATVIVGAMMNLEFVLEFFRPDERYDGHSQFDRPADTVQCC